VEKDIALRAIVIGLLGAAVLCGFTYFNDCVLKQSLLISDHMPVVVYGGLILAMAVLNPLLGRLGRRLPLSPREVAVILALILCSCCIPAFGLMRTFTTSLMLPHHQRLSQVAWRENKVVEALPPMMLADPSQDSDTALTGFVQGMAVGDDHISLAEVPWRAWTRTLAFWLPLVLVLWLGMLALALVVHPQWANHEQLPYPIARFANAFLPSPGNEGRSVLKSRMFWVSCGSVFTIYAWNYAYGWFPQLVPIKVYYSFHPLRRLFETFVRGGGGRLLGFTLRFMPIGFAYFLSSDVSLSLGIGPFLWCLVVGIFLGYGIPLEEGGYLSIKTATFLNFGAYFGFLLTILYSGRQYYLAVSRRALGLECTERVETSSVWGARVFAVCAISFVLLLCRAGLDWQLAIPYAAGTIMIFLVMGRITAETGLFFIQVWTFPCVVIWGFMGTEALGPDTILLLCLLSCVLLLDPREALMPYVVNSFRLLDWNETKTHRVVPACAIALILGLAIAVPATLYFQYDRGITTSDSWTQLAAGFPFVNAIEARQELAAQGRLNESLSYSGFQRFAHLRPIRRGVIAFAVGLGLVLVLAFCRLRFTRWPLHPVMLLVWGTFPAWRFAPCFLIGWALKQTIVKYGGANLYRRLMPLFTGLIAGEVLGYLFGVVVGLAYYFITGELPRYTLAR
jgi:hypothetical protein